MSGYRGMPRYPPGYGGAPRRPPPGYGGAPRPPPGYGGPPRPPPGYGRPPPPGPPPRGVDLRRATAGRQIDPNRYDTGTTYHQLFVKVNEANDRSPRAQQVKQITMQMLQFVHKLLPTLKQMGIQIKVNQVFDKHLRNKRFTDTLKGRGITNLPALLTQENVYIGVKEIQDLYYRNIRAYHSERTRETPNFSDMAPEDELEQFYANETGDDAWDEAEAGDMEEENMGESSDMMDSYNRMLSRRERMNEARKGSGRRSGRQSERSEKGTGRRGGRGGRRTEDTNVDDFDMTMNQMIRDIDSNVVDEAFSGSGGDSFEDDGGNGNAQDDLMETAFWNNMMESV